MKPRRWALRGYQIRDDAGLGRHIATYQTNEADGRLLAAAPELHEMLCGVLDNLDESTRREFTERLARMGLGVLPEWVGP